MLLTLIGFLFLFSVGDGRLGYPEEAPFDAIHVGAAAPNLPHEVLLVFTIKASQLNVIPLKF